MKQSVFPQPIRKNIIATQDELRRVVAEKAVEFIPENEYIDISTGSTINIFIEVLDRSGERIKGAVSTSVKSGRLLAKYGTPEISLSDVSGLAVYMNSADEVNRMLQIVKGGGGTYLNEEIVANASDKFICVADKSRYVSRLGKFPLPAEVTPHARLLVSRKLVTMGGEPGLRVGFTTFNGNQIVDVHGLHIDRPVSMEDEINRITGVVGNGIFDRNTADVLILSTEQGARVTLPGQNWLESDDT